MNYSLSYPALNGETVTQGHANYCAVNGCATYIKDGMVQAMCPRCGEMKAVEAEPTPGTLAKDVAALKDYMEALPAIDRMADVEYTPEEIAEATELGLSPYTVRLVNNLEAGRLMDVQYHEDGTETVHEVEGGESNVEG